jgi:hypothetical protein
VYWASGTTILTHRSPERIRSLPEVAVVADTDVTRHGSGQNPRYRRTRHIWSPRSRLQNPSPAAQGRDCGLCRVRRPLSAPRFEAARRAGRRRGGSSRAGTTGPLTVDKPPAGDHDAPSSLALHQLDCRGEQRLAGGEDDDLRERRHDVTHPPGGPVGARDRRRRSHIDHARGEAHPAQPGDHAEGNMPLKRATPPNTHSVMPSISMPSRRATTHGRAPAAAGTRRTAPPPPRPSRRTPDPRDPGSARGRPWWPGSSSRAPGPAASSS